MDRSSTLGWIALSLAFVWVLPLGLLIGPVDTALGLVCSVAAAALAIVVLLRPRSGFDLGRVLAGIALAGVAAHVVVTLTLSLILGSMMERFAPEILEDAEWAAPPVETEPGDCLVSDVRPAPTPCDEPHRAEVVGTYTLTDQGWFHVPDGDAEEICLGAVADYLDISEEEASWRYGFSVSADEPYQVVCWAVSEDPITGTMRVARR